jgi:type IV pilus assembly protein PilC
MSLIVTPRQLTRRAEFYQQLASLLTAGVGVIQALDMIQRSPRSWSTREPIKRVISGISQGATFAESVLSQGRWLPTFDLALIRAAEESGRLPESFRLLAGYYTERAQLARSVIARIAYPAFILHFAILVFPPSQLGQLVLQGNVAAFLWSKLQLLLPGYALLFLIAFACQGRHGESWRSFVEKILHGIPVLGQARRNLALARLSAALEGLISAGVSIIDAWELSADASGSPTLRRAVRPWRNAIQSGDTPGELVNQTRVFPELFANLYHTGEVSGQLDDTLRRLHNHYQEEGSRKLQTFAFWVPVLIYLAIAIAIGAWIIRFWMGYFQGITEQINF